MPGKYDQEISRERPALFFFVLDQSFSMDEPLGGSNIRKCDQLVDVINNWLRNMIIKASAGDMVKDWMHVGVIGYRTDELGTSIIDSAFSKDGTLGAQAYVPISQIYAQPMRIDTKMQKMYDEETGEMTEFPVEVPVWIDPVFAGGTPMCEVLDYAYQVMEYWAQEHQDCFPPILINITDGESQDGDPIPKAEKIQTLATKNGHALVFNCHLSMMAAESLVFPSSDEVMPEQLARILFRMSSVLPEPMLQRAILEGHELQPNARGMVYNADMIALLQFLEMGTRISKNLR